MIRSADHGRHLRLFWLATLHTSKRPETAALLLHNEVLPFYAERGIKVGTVLTDNGVRFCDAPKNRSGPTAMLRVYRFDGVCRSTASSIAAPGPPRRRARM
jgi:hypothetical protein